MNQGIFNRLGFNLINWQFVESIEYEQGTHDLKIFYASGKVQSITNIERINAFLDIMDVFPDIEDYDTRIAIKQKMIQQNQKVGMDMPLSNNSKKSPFEHSGMSKKTDIKV